MTNSERQTEPDAQLQVDRQPQTDIKKAAGDRYRKKDKDKSHGSNETVRSCTSWESRCTKVLFI